MALYSQPMILPFNADGTVYVVQDEDGKIVGTGDREVCAVLFEMMKRAKTGGPFQTSTPIAHTNIRSAITV